MFRGFLYRRFRQLTVLGLFGVAFVLFMLCSAYFRRVQQVIFTDLMEEVRSRHHQPHQRSARRVSAPAVDVAVSIRPFLKTAGAVAKDPPKAAPMTVPKDLPVPVAKMSPKAASVTAAKDPPKAPSVTAAKDPPKAAPVSVAKDPPKAAPVSVAKDPPKLLPTPASTLQKRAQLPVTTTATSARATTATTRLQGQVGPDTKFKFRNGENFCKSKGRNVSTIVSVHSAPPHFNNRKVIRKTWGSPEWSVKYNFAVWFVVGITTSNETQKELDSESASLGDIIQYDRMDHYYNMTYKSLAELRFLQDFCADSPYRHFLKMDDDMFVNIGPIIDFLHNQSAQNAKKAISCERVRYNEPVLRDEGNKWRVAKEDYAPDVYPTYCAGTAYSFSKDLIAQLLAAARQIKFFWIDDAYITGMLAERVGNVTFKDFWRRSPSLFVHTAQNVEHMVKLYDQLRNVTVAGNTTLSRKVP